MEPTPVSTQIIKEQEKGPFPSPQETVTIPASHLKKNIYPMARHLLLIVAIAFGVSIILFLIHQNGKSIYDNGL